MPANSSAYAIQGQSGYRMEAAQGELCTMKRLARGCRNHSRSSARANMTVSSVTLSRGRIQIVGTEP